MDIYEKKKDPILLDFSGDVFEALKKLESILCTTVWKSCLRYYTGPNEDILLLELLRERAIVIGEAYYMPAENTEELVSKANQYLHYLSKRKVDHEFFNAVNQFSKYEVDSRMTDRFALFYPDIKAYVRSGVLVPIKLFELLQKDCCERVIVFGGIQPDDEQPEEAFYSFEMRAPKEYILERLAKMRDKRRQGIRNAMERIELNKIYDSIIPSVYNEE